jgi:hypothetical protein
MSVAKNLPGRLGDVNRRILEGILVTTVLARPVFGSIRLWSVKTMHNTTPGTVLHTFAEVVAILL